MHNNTTLLTNDNFMKKSILTLLLCFAVSLGAYAQGYSISGTVVDSQDVPIIGATVMEAGTSTGMITDAEGAWSDLVVSGPEALISISCIGYKTVTLYASEIKEEPVVLKDDTELIDDAVVIGYGTVKKSDLTGSITAIKAEEINRGAVTTATDLLKGKVPGMLVLGDGTIRIRGISSLNASNDPLVVVDGIPLNSNGLSAINPDDIESFSVLKDASSAAIYGSRAAAGVIMVTTKKASSSKTPRISYRGSVGVQHYIGKMDLMDAPELREYMDELYAGNSWALETIDRLMGDANTDWVDEITRLGETSTHNLSISGTAAKGNLPYRLSLGYIQRIGTTLGSWSHMPNASVTLSPTFLDEHLTVTLDAKVNSRISSPQSASYMAAAEFDPSQPIYFYNADGSIDYSINDGYYVKGTMSDGKFVPASEAETNPMQYATNDYRRHNFGYIVSGVVNYKVHGFEDLSFNLRLSSDGTSSETWSRPKPNYWEVIIDSYAPGTGTNTNSAARYGNEMLEFYANYQHDFSGHNLNLMGGYSWQHFGVYTSNAQYYNADGVNAKGEPVVGGTEVVPSTARYEENFLVSFYGRLNYSFKSRYMFTATLRYDGSSRFAPDTRWGLFPSLAAAWNIKNENFLKNEESVDELKLRVGWGVTGQQNGIANYSYIPNYLLDTGSGGFKYIYNMGTDGRVNYIVPQPYEPNTRWEQTATANVGVDFSFFDGLIAGNIDLYQRDTKDLLNEVKIPMGSNFSNKVLTNIGSMVNRGVEIGLTSNPISTPEMSLLIGANVTFQDTEFTKLTTGSANANADYAIQINWADYDLDYTGGYISQHKVGYAPGVFVLYEQEYDEQGRPIQNAVKDRDNDGRITDDDRYITDKSPLPKAFFGLNVKFVYKNWDFGLNGHGSAGNYVFSKFLLENSTPANTWLNFNEMHNFNRVVRETGWTGVNENQQIYSDYWLHDGSFFKIDDINVGYTFHDVFKNGSNIRLAFSVDNVLLLTKCPAVDPEQVTSLGVNENAIPRTRSWTLRVNINF